MHGSSPIKFYVQVVEVWFRARARCNEASEDGAYEVLLGLGLDGDAYLARLDYSRRPRQRLSKESGGGVCWLWEEEELRGLVGFC